MIPGSGTAYAQNDTLPECTANCDNKYIAVGIKQQTHELAQKIASYPREIEVMVHKSVIVNDLPQDLKQFKDVKLYGTMINYHGYGLMASMNANTLPCVLDCILARLNNENEPNKKHRIMKRTIQ